MMKKGEDFFPVDLSCESLFAEDWVYEKNKNNKIPLFNKKL